MKYFIVLAAILIAGCTQAPIHNDQRNCTHDCRIGSSAPVYAAPAYVAAPVYHRRFMSPSLYHPYRGYGQRRRMVW